jgi:hypothetical protein
MHFCPAHEFELRGPARKWKEFIQYGNSVILRAIATRRIKASHVSLSLAFARIQTKSRFCLAVVVCPAQRWRPNLDRRTASASVRVSGMDPG